MDANLDQIDRLFALKEKGVLSEDEFQAEKRRILDQTARAELCMEPVEEAHSVDEGFEDAPKSRNWAAPVFAGLAIIGAATWGYFALQPSSGNEMVTSNAAVTDGAASGDDTSTKPEKAALRAPSKAELLGKNYDDSLRGSTLDPVLGLDRKGAFDQTLSGPQTPSVITRINGKEILVWENCTAHLCGDSRSIVAVELNGAGRFAATIIDGRTNVLRNAWFGSQLLANCGHHSCDFAVVEQPMGSQASLAPLTDSDLAWAQGGASCSATNSAGQRVFYTEGKAVLRFKGQLRNVEEAGSIGAGPFYSDDGPEKSLVVEIAERNGKRENMEEGVRYPAYLKIFDGSWVSVPVTMECGA